MWLEGLFLPRKTTYDLSCIKECLCRNQLLDEALERRPISHTLPEVHAGSLSPLWVELNGFCLGRAGIESLQQVSDQSSLIERILSPFIGGDLLLFLELSHLYKCLEITIDVLIIAITLKVASGGLIVSFLRSIKGECQLEYSKREDLCWIQMAAETFLNVPHVIEKNLLTFDEPAAQILRNSITSHSLSLDGNFSLELAGFLCLNKLVAEYGPGPFDYLFRAHSISDLISSVPSLFLKVVCVLKLQHSTERLRRKRLLTVSITAGHRLVKAIEECIISAEAEALDCADTVDRLRDDLRAAWTLVFECSRAVGYFDEAFMALKAMRDVGASDMQVDVNLSALLVSACESGHLNWICKIPEFSGISIASHIERLHFTIGLSGNRIFLDCALAYLVSKRHLKDAARVADSVASFDLSVNVDHLHPIKLFAVAILCLRSLPSDQSFVLCPQSDGTIARKRYVDGGFSPKKKSCLHMRTLPIISRDFAFVYSRSLLKHIPDSLCTGEYVFKELIATERLHEAFYFAMTSELSHVLKDIFMSFPSEFRNASDALTLDCVSGHTSSSLSSAHIQHHDNDMLYMLGKLPKSYLQDVLASCELTVGGLLNLKADEIVLRALISQGDLTTACKIATRTLSGFKMRRLGSYSYLDILILKCRQQLELGHGGQLHSQYLSLLQSIRGHFLALVVV